MVTRSVLLLSITLLSCSSLSTNFKVISDLKELTFKCYISDESDNNFPLYYLYLDTSIHFKIINNSNIDVYFFHDKTFTIPNESKFSPLSYSESNTIIRYYDQDKNEIYGRFSTIYIDSSFVGPEYFTPEFIDTTSYEIKKFDTLQISQKVKLPYNKNTFSISLNVDTCKRVHFLKFCISQGKKKKNKLFGSACSDFINVVHN